MYLFEKIEKKIRYNKYFILALFSIFQYRHVIFGEKLIGWDSLDAIFPNFLYIVDCLKNLKFPYYNPFTQGGYSLTNNFFTVYLFNPFDLFMAVCAQAFNPLYVFQLQFPVVSIASGWMIYRYMERKNRDFGPSMLAAISFPAFVMYPLAGQLPFFYAFFMFSYLISLHEEIIKLHPRIGIVFASIVLMFLLVKSYFFFIPFFITLSLTQLLPGRSKGEKAMIITSLLAASVGYFIINYPVYIMLKSGALDLNGSFVSPEPRLRSLVPMGVSYATSPWVSVADIVDNRNWERGAWTEGFNYLFLYAYFVCMFRVFSRENRKNWGKGVLSVICVALFILLASGKLKSIHSYIPLVSGSRWGFSYVHFAQIFFLDIVCWKGFEINRIKKVERLVITIFVILVALNTSNFSFNLSSVVTLIIILLSIIVFNFKSLYFTSFIFLITIGYIFRVVPFNTIDKKNEYREVNERNHSVLITKNEREVGSIGEYKYQDRQWIYKKEMTLNGYNNSIHPSFWYMKGREDFKKIVIPLCTLPHFKKRKSYPVSDNLYLESWRDDLVKIIQNNNCDSKINKISVDSESFKYISSSRYNLILQNLSGFRSEHSYGIKFLSGSIALVEGQPFKEVILVYSSLSSKITMLVVVMSFIFLIILIPMMATRVIKNQNIMR